MSAPSFAHARRFGRARRVAALTALLTITATGIAHADTSDPSDGGLWYYTQSGMDQIHQRTTGEGVTIAVMDTAINMATPGLAGADIRVHEPGYCSATAHGPGAPAETDAEWSQHGSGITSVLVGSGERPDGKPGIRGIAPGATIRFYATAPLSQTDGCFIPGSGADESQAFRDAIADGADIINVSGSIALEHEDYAAAIRAGVIVVGAAGNRSGPVIEEPAALNGAVSVGYVTPDLNLDPSSPSGPLVGLVAPGSEYLCFGPDLVTEMRCTGSSLSAAYTSGVLALAMSAYPDATSNQILQALVRSTDGAAVHEPRRDDQWGYGLVSARLLLETDPTTFPDVNPFIRDAADAVPPADDLVGTSAQRSAPPAAATGAGDSDTAPAPSGYDDAGGISLLVVAVGLAVALAAAGVATTVVLARRRRARTDTAARQHHPAGEPPYGAGRRG